MKTYLTSINGKRINYKIPWNADNIINDLGLKPILNAMSSGDDYLYKNIMNYILSNINSVDEILYRQDILKDFIKNNDMAERIYNNASEFIDLIRRNYLWFSDSLSFNASIGIITDFIKYINELRKIFLEYNNFSSNGLKKFYNVIFNDFGTDYMDIIKNYLVKLNFNDGIEMSVSLGPWNSRKNYRLNKPYTGNSIRKFIEKSIERHYTYVLAERDINGAQEVSDIKNRALKKTSFIITNAAKNIMEFYNDIKSESGFYLSAVNLFNKIGLKNGKICFPVPLNDMKTSFNGLYDLGLFLSTESKVITNDINSDAELFIITGTNRGGKTTFLRSIGQAQILMQSGLFVPAESFSANIVSGIYTHFKHEEDKSLDKGKFDDELSKMDDIVKHLMAKSMILFNESFSSTNTREGSEIAMGITRALIENGIKIFFVTHLYEFASSVYNEINGKSMFLITERTNDGGHTFKIIPGEPSETGYGMDLYNRIFME
jgi:DNA mismatch repair ATPase MutS